MEPALLLSWPVVATQFFVVLTSIVFWRRFCSPLKDIPGPPVAAVSRLWHIYRICKGDQNLALIEQHEKHGQHGPGLQA